VFLETLPTQENANLQWRSELKAIRENVRDIRQWIASVSQLAAAPYQEFASRTQGLEGRIRSHFSLSSELYDSLRDELWCVEVEAAKGSSEADQKHLLGRLQSFVSRLSEESPSFESFADAADCLEWVLDELDQHQEQEADRFEWLLQSHCG